MAVLALLDSVHLSCSSLRAIERGGSPPESSPYLSQSLLFSANVERRANHSLPPCLAMPKCKQPSMHSFTFDSVPELESHHRGNLFQASYHISMGAFLVILMWHLYGLRFFSESYQTMSSISAIGSATFLLFRKKLHDMGDPIRAHHIFSQTWAFIFVAGHSIFIARQTSSPQRIEANEAIGTAFIWITLCILQHLLLIDRLYSFSVIFTILLANAAQAGRSWIVPPRTCSWRLLCSSAHRWATPWNTSFAPIS